MLVTKNVVFRESCILSTQYLHKIFVESADCINTEILLSETEQWLELEFYYRVFDEILFFIMLDKSKNMLVFSKIILENFLKFNFKNKRKLNLILKLKINYFDDFKLFCIVAI